MPALEDLIRDQLSKKLDLIEPGLQLVKNNYKLNNDSGSSGFIDILARDSTGVFVVIELKRSDNAAREALHEIGKYARLLTQSRGLSPDMLRTIIVSTTWRELLVPFSYYVESADFPLEGYELTVGLDGVTPVLAARVEPLPVPEARTITETQWRFEGLSGATPEDEWEKMRTALVDLGAPDFVGYSLSNPLHGKMIVVAMGAVTDRSVREYMVELLMKQEEFEREDLEDYTDEEIVRTGLEWSDHSLLPSDPSRVSALLGHHGWVADKWLRSGVFEDELIYPESDLADMLDGWGGALSDSTLKMDSRRSHRGHWRKFRGGVERVTRFNSAWGNILQAWLNELEAVKFSDVVKVGIYDEGDIVQSLLHGGYTANLADLLPQLIAAADSDQVEFPALFGCLTWSGASVDLKSGLVRSYATPGDWGGARYFNSQRELNNELLSAWGLKYTIFGARRDGNEPVPVGLIEGGLRETSLELHRPLGEFFDEHADQLQEIFERLSNDIVIDESRALQMHFSVRDGGW